MSSRARGAAPSLLPCPPRPTSLYYFQLIMPRETYPPSVFITAFKLNSFSARPVRLVRVKQQFPRSGAQLGESGTETGLRNGCRYLATKSVY